MNEKNLTTVLEALAQTIEDLKLQVSLLKYDKKKLEEELALYKSPITDKRGE